MQSQILTGKGKVNKEVLQVARQIQQMYFN
jgi:hypothetical protein